MGLQINLFGSVAVDIDGIRYDGWPRPAARRMVALLALTPDRAMSREALVEHLFAHLPRDRGLRNVSKALSQARTVLGPDLLAADSGTIRLVGEVTTDLEDAKATLRNLDDPEAVRAALTAAPDLLLEDMYEEWAQPYRWELEALARRAALELARLTDHEDDWNRVAVLMPRLEEAWLSLVRHASVRGRAGVTEVLNRCRLAGARDGYDHIPEAVETEARELLSQLGAETHTVTVGRDRELDQIIEALERRVPTLLVGTAGVGKTHLLRLAVEWAHSRGRPVAFGTSSPDDALHPFSALRAAFGPLPAELPPFLGGAEAAAEVGPAQMAAETVSMLKSLPVPPLVVLDDAQWADPALKAMLTPLAAHACVHSLPLLVAARSDEPNHPVPAWPSEGAVIALEELSGNDAVVLARRLLGTESVVDPVASESLARSLAQRSGGNPFFLTELVRAASTGERPGENEPVPERIGALIRGRIAGLDPDATRLVRLIALADDHGGNDLVNDVGASGDVLIRLRDRGVVAPNAIQLTHPLLRDYVVASMSPEERRDTHLQIADYLTRAAERVGRPDLRAAAGAHRLAAYEAAPAADLAESALEGALVAGAAAARSYAAPSVIRILEPAYNIYRRLAPERRQALASSMAARILDLGEAWRLQGDEEQAEIWFHRALDIADRPLDRAHCYRALAWLPYRRGDMAGAGAVLGLGMADIDDELAHAVLEAELAWTWHRQGRRADAYEPLLRATELMEDAGAWTDAIRGLDYLGMTLIGLGRSEEGRQVLERALVLNGSSSARRRGILLMHRATCLNHLDRTDEALVSVQDGRRILENLGDPYLLSVSYWVEAEIRDNRGEPGEAIAARQRELELLSGSNPHHAEAARRHIDELQRQGHGSGNTAGTLIG